jgi:arylsulfatase A
MNTPSRRAFLLSAGGLALSGTARSAERPNIVLFLADDFGAADLGCYGARDIRTPQIDSLAREGVRFTQCYSNGPVCTPTRAALLTGRYQQRFGLEWALTLQDRGYGLSPEHPTIARRLKEAGYHTALFGKWHLGREPEYRPNRHGFDESFGILGGNADMYSHRNMNGEPDLYENGEAVEQQGYLTEMIAERSVDFVRRNARGPFFLYVAFNAVHWPFQAPHRPQDVRTRPTWFDGSRADYARMTESMDQAVGRVLAELDRHGLRDNTLVIFTNDNGGERLSNNTPFFHHKGSLWEGGIRVPGLVRWPTRVRGGKTSDRPTMSMDFAATVLSAAGVQPRAPLLDGMDLLPVLTGSKPPVERSFFWRIERNDRKQKAARVGSWKYVRDGDIELLFDVVRDPGERTDMGYREPETLARLRGALADWEKDLAQSPPPRVIR